MKTNLWGPILTRDWKQVAHLSGRTANETDVIEGRAVFYVNGEAKPHQMDLPCCAIQVDEETGKEIPVIVIQAEDANGDCILGLRYLTGGNGICSLKELCLLEGPDDRFVCSISDAE